MISTKQKYIFIHIPKTAGKTIYFILPDGTHNSKAFPQLRMAKMGEKYMHLTAQEIKNNMPANIWEEYYKFSFVRNPWDRVVSEFFWRKRRPNRKQFDNIYEMLVFIREGGVEKMDSNRHFEPQYKMVYDYKGDLLVDYIGRYENFGDDVQSIFESIDLKKPDKIPKINASKRDPDYRRYFNNRTKELVKKVYYEDINYFNYTY